MRRRSPGVLCPSVPSIIYARSLATRPHFASLLFSNVIGFTTIVLGAGFSGAKIGVVAPVDTSSATAGVGAALGCAAAEYGDHELRFMLFCFRMPSWPAARMAACPSGTVRVPFRWLVPLPLLLPALEGGRGFDVSDAGEKAKDDTESLDEHGFDSDEPLEEFDDCE